MSAVTSPDGVMTGPNPPERVLRSTNAHTMGTPAVSAIR